MAKGSSGRVVIVVEPGLKRDLYVELARRGLTLKDWFIDQATHFLETSHQPLLFVAEEISRYGSELPSSDLTSAEEDGE